MQDFFSRSSVSSWLLVGDEGGRGSAAPLFASPPRRPCSVLTACTACTACREARGAGRGTARLKGWSGWAQACWPEHGPGQPAFACRRTVLLRAMRPRRGHADMSLPGSHASNPSTSKGWPYPAHSPRSQETEAEDRWPAASAGTQVKHDRANFLRCLPFILRRTLRAEIIRGDGRRGGGLPTGRV